MTACRATRLPARPLPGGEAEHDAHAARQRDLDAGPGAGRKRPAPSAARRRCRSTGSWPRRCPGRSRPATRRGRSARATARSRCPGTAGCEASCPAVRVVVTPGRPSAARPSRCVVRAQAPRRRPAGRLRRARVEAHVWPSQLSAGTAVVSWIDARSCSHCAITRFEAQRLLEPHLVRLARADDAVDALPRHQRHDRHHDHRDQHLDKVKPRQRLARGPSPARGWSRAAGSGWPSASRMRASTRRKFGFGVGRTISLPA